MWNETSLSEELEIGWENELVSPTGFEPVLLP